MAYKIVYIPEALKQLSKLDKTVAKNIVEYMKDKAEEYSLWHYSKISEPVVKEEYE